MKIKKSFLHLNENAQTSWTSMEYTPDMESEKAFLRASSEYQEVWRQMADVTSCTHMPEPSFSESGEQLVLMV